MSEPFIAEIRIFAGNFAPRGWAFCNGQLLPIAQNTALFSLIGTIYGGDGRTTVGLPDLQGRAPMHAGRGPGLTDRRLGQRGGTSTVTLTEAQMAQHTHTLQAVRRPGNQDDPNNTAYYGISAGATVYRDTADGLTGMAAQALPQTGGSQPHSNYMPYLAINFIIALVGLYPTRS
jgi:microcystin-dependent protein